MPLQRPSCSPRELVEIDPEALASAEEFLREIGTPQRKTFTPAQLYELVSKRIDPEHPKGSVRTWQRRMSMGDLRSVRNVTTWNWLVMFFAVRPEKVDEN